MGDVISLSERRRALRPDAHGDGAPSRGLPATFYFDLALPGTYLAAERVDRLVGDVRWRPASVGVAGGAGADGAAAQASLMSAAAERAAALSLPLVWPERFPLDARAAMRVAALACTLGRGAPFVLAASRLSFCGGFDLADPETLAEAAAAADLPLDAALRAARDARHDRDIAAAGERLRARGAAELPALGAGRRLFAGEPRIAEALAASAVAIAPRAAGVR